MHASNHKLNIAFIIATCILSNVFSLQSFAHENHGAVKKHGRFTPNVEGAEFPPQPRNIKNIKQIKPKKRSKAKKDKRKNILQTVLYDSSVQQELGERYAHINTAPVTSENKGKSTEQRLIFFSHSNNQTVTVITAGKSVKSVQTEPASENQPELAQSEQARSIEIARQYWLDRGNTEVDSLTGYAIQTFQRNGSPFSTRMAYVSFHTQSPEAPQFFNWIDLTDEVVVSGDDE